MPTIVNEDGYRLCIWPLDHEPPHVHVFKAGNEAVIYLDPLDLRSVEGMTLKQARRAFELATLHREALLEAWRKIHE